MSVPFVVAPVAVAIAAVAVVVAIAAVVAVTPRCCFHLAVCLLPLLSDVVLLRLIFWAFGSRRHGQLLCLYVNSYMINTMA